MLLWNNLKAAHSKTEKGNYSYLLPLSHRSSVDMLLYEPWTVLRYIAKIKLCKTWRQIYRYGDVIMGVIASEITSLTIVYSTVYSDADQRKHQSSASLAFVWGIHRGLVNSPHKWPATRKMFPFDDVITRTHGTYSVADAGSIRAHISNNTHGYMWEVITHPCPNFTGGLDKVRAWISNYNPTFYVYVII